MQPFFQRHLKKLAAPLCRQRADVIVADGRKYLGVDPAVVVTTATTPEPDEPTQLGHHHALRRPATTAMLLRFPLMRFSLRLIVLCSRSYRGLATIITMVVEALAVFATHVTLPMP
jgi:hypothetical protein